MTEDHQEKKAQFETGRQKNGFTGKMAALALVVIATGISLALFLLLKPGGGADLVKAEQGAVTIPLAEVNDGKAHFYHYAQNGKQIDFFLLKSADGTVRAAFDSCDVCFRERKGYRQEGDFMVCNNCNQKFRSDLINEIKGGCNPAPLNRLLNGDKVVIAVADLERGASYFQ